MKPHYFGDPAPDPDDWQLDMAKGQGYVPSGCLLGGAIAMGEVNAGRDPCAGCAGPRARCGGRPERKPAHIQAVDECFGPPGSGPFAPSYRTEGGSTRPVIHSEEAAIDRDQAGEG